jgi:hypothetical protein
MALYSGEMTRELIVVAGLILLRGGCFAQDLPRGEIFGGYSLEHISACGAPGDTFLTCSAFIETGTSKPANYNGWEASATGFIYKFLGVTGDFSGHYGTTTIQNSGLPTASVSRFSFMAGPVAALRGRRLAPFAHALFGGVVNRFGAVTTGPDDSVTPPSYTKFSWVVGGGVDANISRHLAVRVGQFDFERVDVPASTGSYPPVNGFRFSSGIVFRP